MLDLDLMTKAAGVAVRAHLRRPPLSSLGKKPRTKKAEFKIADAVAPLLSRAAMRAERAVAGGITQAATHAPVATGAAALVPGAHTTAAELGAALRFRKQQQGAQQLATALGHAPAPGANPFLHRPTVPAPPTWLGKTASITERDFTRALPREVDVSGRAAALDGRAPYGAPSAFGARTSRSSEMPVNGTIGDLLVQMFNKQASLNPPNSLTPKHVTEALEKLRKETLAKRVAEAGQHAVQKARYDARQMGAAVGSSR